MGHTDGSSNVIIGILDTGIDGAHTDLSGKVVPGYDFLHGDNNTAPDMGGRAPNHGTSVAGISAAKTNNNSHVPGLCGGNGISAGCLLLDAKILGDGGWWEHFKAWVGSTSVAANAASWVVANGAQVINNSWCSESQSSTLHAVFRNAHLAGILTVAGSGNTDYYPDQDRWGCDQNAPNVSVAPAAWSDVVTAVGATNESAARITRSGGYNWESGTGWVAVMAPGVNHGTLDLANGTHLFAGTSAATPFVSGIAGLIYSEALAKGWSFSSRDVGQLIKRTAFDLETPGWDTNTGYGLVRADSALKMLQPPNHLTFESVGPTATTCYAQSSIQTWTFLASLAVKPARRCEIRRNITFPIPYQSAPLVWGRMVAGGGITPSAPNSEVSFTDVVDGSVTTTGATLKTFVYETWALGSGAYEGWYPRSPSNVSLAYAAVGRLVPHSVTATAPSFVTVKTTHSLTGAGAYPTGSWQWDRSDNGGSSWYLWDNAQNSSFISYAGDYTIDWRVTGTRNADGSPAGDSAQTIVCVQTPGCLAFAAPGVSATSQTTQSRTGAVVTHFGSGVWLLGNRGNGEEMIQLYSFSGAHRDSIAKNPNFIAGNARSAQASRGALPVAASVQFERTGRGTGWDTYAISPSPGWSTLRLGIALDPDIGESAADDELAVDSTGLVVVKDASGVVAYRLRRGTQIIRPIVRQYSNRQMARTDPRSDVEAIKELVATHHALSEGPQDVRFLLTVPASVDLSDRPSSRLELVVVQADRQEDLTSRLSGVPSQTDGPVPEQPGDAERTSTALREFAMRLIPSTQSPSLRPVPIAASVVQSETADVTQSVAAMREMIRTRGITSVGISIPTQQQVTVRVFAPNGRLIRTLVSEVLSIGSYRLDWDTRNSEGVDVAAGVYVVTMEAGRRKFTRRFVVVR